MPGMKCPWTGSRWGMGGAWRPTWGCVERNESGRANENARHHRRHFDVGGGGPAEFGRPGVEIPSGIQELASSWSGRPGRHRGFETDHNSRSFDPHVGTDVWVFSRQPACTVLSTGANL